MAAMKEKQMNLKSKIRADGTATALLFLYQFHHALSILTKAEFQKPKYSNYMYISSVLLSNSLHLEDEAVLARRDLCLDRSKYRLHTSGSL